MISEAAGRLKSARFINPYRVAVAAGFLAAAVLILVTPLRMPDPDDWAYYNGTRNFSEGNLTVSYLTVYRQSMEIGEAGGWLIQYLPVNEREWALEKAPGYVFYLVPFWKAGIPRYGNVLLALGMVLVTYVLLKRLKDEKAAMIGSLLMLFTPIGLVMLNRAYMETYSSLAFLVIGAGLYIYYHLERRNLSRLKGGMLLFLAFFFTGWSVIARYTNIPIAVLLALHMVIVCFADWRKGRETGIVPEIVPAVLGAGLPLAGILLYDYFVFGSPLTYGYSISPYPIKFAFQYIGQADQYGESIPLQILRYNLEGMARNVLIGFPQLIVGIPGFAVICWQKTAAWFRRKSSVTGSGLQAVLPWGLLLLFAGWFISVFVLYLGYEWTAGLQDGGGFVVFNRFLLPGLFPAAVVAALVLARFPYKVVIPVMAVLAAAGILLYLQWNLDLHILPDWLTFRTLDSRWPGYIFPPWVDWPPY